MSGARSSRTLLRQEVVEGIKKYILRERLRPGDLLPTETALCEALGASRSSVREAIKILDALDIVDVRHGHGTYVGRLSLSALVESLTFRGLLSPGDDFRVMADLVDVRELFERGMAERIVSSLDDGQLDALDSLVRAMRETGAGDGSGYVAADRAFHELLVSPVGNELISQLSMAFWDVYTVVAPHLAGFTPVDEESTVRAHQALVDAARAKDVPAFLRALEEHYAPVRRRVGESRAAGSS
ncbi:FadR/GntR family transcriptional regulator [Streptomyces sp. CRN 30]|uniref:FadR/GntR family transcriptional regulator n=1 Tax=Streptomyces sp. CRN 30 TaxID=3075613 RepID=UPI002A83DF1F|nr:FadR/GntR family transcriptional regulator [Streptomyces sp. CRN 30]